MPNRVIVKNLIEMPLEFMSKIRSNEKRKID